MRVEWSLTAITDLERIKEYIALDSEYYSLKIVEGAFDAVERLETFPSSGRTVPEMGRKDVREIIYGSYRIIYCVEDERVVILTVIHAMRNFTGL